MAEADGVSEGGHLGGNATGVDEVLVGYVEFPGDAPSKG